MEEEMEIDNKNKLIMKLLHYFVTEENYNPIILQGVENEIWLENLESDYKVVRIVSGHIHNEEQMDYDRYKREQITKKIKLKTFSFSLPILNIYIDLGDNIELDNEGNISSIYIQDTSDFDKYDEVVKHLPDLKKNLKFKEDGVELFAKITGDLAKKNYKDNQENEDVFRPKTSYITMILIILNVGMYLFMIVSGKYNFFANLFCNYGPNIRAGEYYRLISSMFIHGDILHLAFNMYALYIVGKQVENYFGRFKFIFIYFFSGIIGNLVSMICNPSASIGASGAIFGLLGTLLYFGYHYRVYLGNVLLRQIVPVIVYNLILGFMIPSIDNFAHIGGLAGGFLLSSSLGLKYKKDKSSQINYTIVTIIFTLVCLYLAFVAKR